MDLSRDDLSEFKSDMDPSHRFFVCEDHHHHKKEQNKKRRDQNYANTVNLRRRREAIKRKLQREKAAERRANCLEKENIKLREELDVMYVLNYFYEDSLNQSRPVKTIPPKNVKPKYVKLDKKLK